MVAVVLKLSDLVKGSQTYKILHVVESDLPGLLS